MRILMIEDEIEIVNFVRLELEHEGYVVEAALDGRSGLETTLENEFDLILLDIMLPELNGLEVLRRLRAHKQTPVILLTARDAIIDKVTGLDTGANDYITKPFHIEELFARIRALTRTVHGETPSEDVLRNADVRLDRKQRLVTRAGAAVTLTKPSSTCWNTSC